MLRVNVQLSVLPPPWAQPPPPGNQAGPSLVVGGGLGTTGPQRLSTWPDGVWASWGPWGRGQGCVPCGTLSGRKGNSMSSVFVFKGDINPIL